MALSTAQTIPLSAQPNQYTNSHQMGKFESASTIGTKISNQAKPTIGNKCMPPQVWLNRQWQKEALAEYSASFTKRAASGSPRLQHARKLLKIAKQQQAAGLHFDGQLTVEQAKACLSLAQRNESNSIYQQLSDNAAEILNMFTNMFAQAEPSTSTASNAGPAWLEEFETATSPYFTVKKSELCKPGNAPSLIVIGDGNHALPDTQHRLTALVKFLEKNGAMTTLVVEYVDPPSIRECRGVPSEIEQVSRKPVRCVGGDHAESTEKVELCIKMMWQAAFDLANEIYQFVKKQGGDDEHLNPNRLMSSVYELNYADIIKVFSTQIQPYYISLESLIRADDDTYLKISDRFMEYQVAYNEFVLAVRATALTRDTHLMQTLDAQIKSGQTVVAVFGDAHVEHNAEALLKKYDCWVLDDKSGSYNFLKPSKT